MKAVVKPGKTFEIETPAGKRMRFAGHEVEVSEGVFNSNQDKLMTLQTKTTTSRDSDIHIKIAELKSKLNVADVRLKNISEELGIIGNVEKAKKEDLVEAIKSIAKIISQ